MLAVNGGEMRAVLEFDLPAESEEHELALSGHKYAIILEEYDNWLRALSKYEDKESITIEEAREKLRELRIETFA